MHVGFIGAGTVGTALAVTLSSHGYVVSAVASRSLSSAQRLADAVNEVVPGTCSARPESQQVADCCDLVFVTTPDDAVVEVAQRTRWRPGQFVVHCSGALSNDSLRSVAATGAIVGGFHPLQSFAGVAEAIQNIPGSMFGLEAEEPLLTVLVEMAEKLNGRWVRLRAEDKVLYHAAAVMTSNYTVALMKMATDLWLQFGVSRAEATQALLPLLRGTVSNIARIGLPGCLTGPIARGDFGTVEKHLAALDAKAPSLAEAYREIGLQAVEVSAAKGKASPEQIQRLRALLANGDHRPATVAVAAAAPAGDDGCRPNGNGRNDHRRTSTRKETKCASLSLR